MVSSATEYAICAGGISLVGDGYDPKPVGVELGRRLLGLREMALIENVRRIVDDVARASRENLLDGPLADEDVSLVATLENDRHAAALEVEGDLVDLSEMLFGLQFCVQLDMLQDCNVEQILQAGLMEAIQIGIFQNAVRNPSPLDRGAASE